MGHLKKEKTGNCIHLTHLLIQPFLSNPALFYGETDNALMGIRGSLSSRDSRMLQCSAIIRKVSMTMIQTLSVFTGVELARNKYTTNCQCIYQIK